MFTIHHTDDCIADGHECQPVTGVWDQPPGVYVAEAVDELGDDAPWCAVQARAFELVDDEA